MVKLRANGIDFTIQLPDQMVGMFLENKLLTSEKEEIGSPTSTRLMSSKARQTAVMTTIATKVEGRSFFRTGMPTLPSTIGRPKQIAVVQIMTTKFRSKPPV